MKIEAYLFFEGECANAIAFYQQALGAEVIMSMRFDEMPEPHEPGMITPETADKILHASLRVGDSVLMMSDGRCQNAAQFEGFALSIAGRDIPHAHQLFDALAAEGTITMPMEETFWSPCFGMVKDKFGVHWMVTVPTVE